MLRRALVLFCATGSVLGATLGLVGCHRATPVFVTTGGDDAPARRGETYRWSFDQGSGAFTGTLPFEAPRRLFFDVLGRWEIAADANAPSLPNVYRQTRLYGDDDAPRVVVSHLSFGDLRARVSCLGESCGLIVRAQDQDDYYLAEADARASSVRLFRVVGGVRDELAAVAMPVDPSRWHALEVSAHKRVLSVTWDGEPILDARDDAFRSGKLGLEADPKSTTAFDDLEVTADGGAW